VNIIRIADPMLMDAVLLPLLLEDGLELIVYLRVQDGLEVLREFIVPLRPICGTRSPVVVPKGAGIGVSQMLVRLYMLIRCYYLQQVIDVVEGSRSE
jgi:hypothetical protein